MTAKDDLLNLAGVAEVVGVDEVEAADLCWNGKIKSVRVGGEFRVWRRNAEAFRDARAPKPEETAPVPVALADDDDDNGSKPKPLGRRTAYVAQMLGGISEKTVTNLLNAPKRAGVPKLEGWRVGRVWLVADEQIVKYVEECKRVARGEKIP